MYPKKLKFGKHKLVLPEDVNENDVLLGRGTGPNDHPGNISFRSIIKDTYEEYTQSNIRGQKTKVARRMIAIIQNGRKGRFLRKLACAEEEMSSSKVSYEVITDVHTLVQKTKQAFRHVIRQGHSSAGPSMTTAATANPPSSMSAVVSSSSLSSATSRSGEQGVQTGVGSSITTNMMNTISNRNRNNSDTNLLDISMFTGGQPFNNKVTPDNSPRIEEFGNRTVGSISSNMRNVVSLAQLKNTIGQFLSPPPSKRVSLDANNNNNISSINNTVFNSANDLSVVQSLVAAQQNWNDSRLRQEALLLDLIARKNDQRNQLFGAWAQQQQQQQQFVSSRSAVSPKMSAILQAALTMTTPLPTLQQPAHEISAQNHDFLLELLQAQKNLR